MTIIVGIKCSDGIVVAADSQSEYYRGVDVKRLNSNKLYEIEGKYLITGAGMIAHIHVLVENIKSQLKFQEASQRSELNKDETERVVEQALWGLVRHYNIDRSNSIGISERENFFSPVAIIAGRNYESGGLEFYCFILHGFDGTIEPVRDYGAAGSGAAYAELLLKSLHYNDITVDEGIKVAVYVINEVKSIDPHCGGDTQLAFIKKTITTDGNINPELQILSKKNIIEISEDTKPILDLIRTELLAKILRGEIDENKIKEITRIS